MDGHALGGWLLVLGLLVFLGSSLVGIFAFGPLLGVAMMLSGFILRRIVGQPEW